VSLDRANKAKIAISFTVLLITVSWWVRIWPFFNYSPIRGVFFANNFYGMVYAIQNGQLYFTGDLGIESGIGSHVYSSSSDLLRTTYGAAVGLILTQSHEPTAIARALNMVPFQGVVLFPLSLLLLVKTRMKLDGDKAVFYTLMLAFGLLGTYNFIHTTSRGGVNVGAGLAFVAMLLWGLQAQIQDAWDWRYWTISTVAMIGVVGWYHTIILVLLIILPTLAGIVYILKRSNSSIILPVVFGLIAFLWLSNVSTTYFTNYVVGAVSLFARLLGEVTIHDAAVSPYRVAIESPLRIRIATIYAKLVVVLGFAAYGLFMLNRHRSSGLPNTRRQKIEALPFAYLLSLAPVFFAILAQYGPILAIHRTLKYGSLMLPAALAVLVVNGGQLVKRPQVRTGLQYVGIFAIVLAVVLSSFAFVSTPTRDRNQVTYSEQAGSEWMVEFGDSDTPVFTDYRLAAPFMTQGFFRISTAYGPRTTDAMSSFYYTNSTTGIKAELKKQAVGDAAPEYIYLSSRMTNPGVGIVVSGAYFQSMSPTEYEKFDRATHLHSIYDSGDGEVFADAQ